MPQNSVHAIAQTPDGYIWFGTEEGIARFDGARFTVINKINADVPRKINVRTLFVDRKGSLWIGTKGEGLLRWHGDGFDVFTKQNNLADNYVNGICEDRCRRSLHRDGADDKTNRRFNDSASRVNA